MQNSWLRYTFIFSGLGLGVICLLVFFLLEPVPRISSLFSDIYCQHEASGRVQSPQGDFVIEKTLYNCGPTAGYSTDVIGYKKAQIVMKHVIVSFDGFPKDVEIDWPSEHTILISYPGDPPGPVYKDVETYMRLDRIGEWTIKYRSNLSSLKQLLDVVPSCEDVGTMCQKNG